MPFGVHEEGRWIGLDWGLLRGAGDLGAPDGVGRALGLGLCGFQAEEALLEGGGVDDFSAGEQDGDVDAESGDEQFLLHAGIGPGDDGEDEGRGFGVFLSDEEAAGVEGFDGGEVAIAGVAVGRVTRDAALVELQSAVGVDALQHGVAGRGIEALQFEEGDADVEIGRAGGELIFC